MTAAKMDAGEAAAALAAIEDIARATRRSVGYRLASAKLILWGGVVAVANLLAFALPAFAGKIWIGMTVLGVAGSLAVGRRMARFGYGPVWRLMAGFALFFGFGLFWSVALGHFDGRQLSAFWPTFVMFGYCVAGLWLGRVFVALGLSISALVAFGYFFVGTGYEFWLAVVNGGGLALCGLWMRRA